MPGIKYMISIVKQNPLIKIKVTGIYRHGFEHFYYRNPVTGRWRQLIDEPKEVLVKGNSSKLCILQDIARKGKNLADKFYNDLKELLGEFEEHREAVQQEEKYI